MLGDGGMLRPMVAVNGTAKDVRGKVVRSAQGGMVGGRCVQERGSGSSGTSDAESWPKLWPSNSIVLSQSTSISDVGCVRFAVGLLVVGVELVAALDSGPASTPTGEQSQVYFSIHESRSCESGTALDARFNWPRDREFYGLRISSSHQQARRLRRQCDLP